MYTTLVLQVNGPGEIEAEPRSGDALALKIGAGTNHLTLILPAAAARKLAAEVQRQLRGAADAGRVDDSERPVRRPVSANLTRPAIVAPVGKAVAS